VAPDQLDKPLSIKRGAVFAVWNDLFHADVPMGFRDRAFNVMRRTPRHAYIVLTKRPGLMAEYIEDALVLPNVFLGTSVENTEQAGVRMPDMRRIAGYRPGERWKTVICCEPLLGSVSGVPGARVNEPLPAWVIAGAETGSGFRPMEFAWAEGLRRRCNTAGIPFWFKTWNNGVRLLGARTWSETPEIPEVEA
jgi:protein gp37